MDIEVPGEGESIIPLAQVAEWDIDRHCDQNQACKEERTTHAHILCFMARQVNLLLLGVAG